MTSDFEQELARERRARLAAEQLLEQKKKELGEANRLLSDHALKLSGKIIDQRKVVSHLEGENSRVTQDLEKANTRAIKIEQLLWDALETIPDGFALFDADYRLLAANRPYLAAFDDSGGVRIGESYQTILDICLDDGLIDLEGQHEDAWYDLMLDRWDDEQISPVTLRFWNGMYVKMVDRKTAEGGIVSLALNVTEEINREEELRSARDKARAADRAKSAFLARMSHELRTPMNGVVGMADLLVEHGLDEEAQLYSETIRSSGLALLEIINNILDFSKLEAEKLEIRRDVFDLERLAQEVCVLVRPTISAKDVELLIDYDQFIPTQFEGDAGRLRQVIVNLVGNAVKFTVSGTIMLRIVGGAASSDDRWRIAITVEDSGIGIMDEMQEHIFGEFNQVEDESNRRYEGTGLGLAITKKLVEAMGGELWLDSVPDQGSCFGFALDLPAIDAGNLPAGALPNGLKTCLIWVTRALDRSLLDRQLTLLGIAPTHVETAAEFDHALKVAVPNVVIASLQRAEAARDLLEQAQIPAPLISIAETPDQSADIPKPFTRALLFSALKEGFAPMPYPGDIPQLRVLAAEDNETNRLVLTKMLDGLDINLQIVGDGLEVVSAFKAERPDLILMDISMPKMDGMEATREIRKLEGSGPHIPIIAMTAHAIAGDEERIRASGVDYYMTKPLRKRDLEHHISEAEELLSKRLRAG